MQLKKFAFATLLVLASCSASAMRPVTISYNQPISVTPITPYYYQAPVVTTYAPTYYYPSYDYAYWPTWGYYDDGYYYYNDMPASTFVKACAVTGVLALAFALINAIMSH